MRAFKKVTVEAKIIKSEMKNFGIKVIRCAKSSSGLSIVIADIENNSDLFIEFCNQKGLKSSPLNPAPVNVSGISGDFIQYGTMYLFEEIK